MSTFGFVSLIIFVEVISLAAMLAIAWMVLHFYVKLTSNQTVDSDHGLSDNNHISNNAGD